jgi:hypothetical protein
MKKSKKSRKVRDVKKAQANDKETALDKLIPRSEVGKGVAMHAIAGSPTKDAVIAVFGKSGYALSWVARAERMSMKAEDLCNDFRLDPKAVKVRWEAVSKK